VLPPRALLRVVGPADSMISRYGLAREAAVELLNSLSKVKHVPNSDSCRDLSMLEALRTERHA
jgi:hypothetical protein